MPKTQLPKYSSLVRWTVQDVTGWLFQAGFNDCIRIFRDAEIDGNRLVNLTDTELRRIKCPNIRIKDLLKSINEVGPPPRPPASSNSGFRFRQPPTQPKKDYHASALPVQQNDEDSVSDIEDWNDFDDEDVNEGVGCDSCSKSNFRGKRYKCLICYDYDLCATCYEAGATTTQHTTDHPVQCILTRSDVDVFFGGEALTAEQPQAFTCPYCSKMGYTEALLQEHVTGEHADTSNEVVCPICASLPGGDPNHVTDDLAAHLTLEHRAPSEIDEQYTGIRRVRRIPPPPRRVFGARTRRTTNMHFSSGGSTLTGLFPSGRENMDPIVELLSQLSSVRSRAAAAQSVSSQLQQLEMQLQTTRQQLELLPRRPAEASKTAASTAAPTSTEPQGGSATAGSTGASNPNSLFLLSRCVDSVINESETDLQQDKLARSLFVQETLLSSFTEHVNLGDEGSKNFDNLVVYVTPLRKENKEPNQKEENIDGPTENVSASTSSKSASEAPTTKSVQKHVEKEKRGCTKQKSSVSNVGLPVNRGGGQYSRVSRQGTGVYQNTGHSQQYRQGGGTVMQHNVDLANLSMNVAVGGGGGANYDTENPQPLPGRPGSGGRDGRLNPPNAKRNMVKHLPTSKTSDREPPPH